MGWFFKGLPSGKRVTPIYPMETPNGVRSTVGGRFIPSGLLLAQDFTHEPACQTGERAPQGRFRHQPEQMVHPSFGQLASFPSLPVCGEEAPYCPLRDFATLRTYSPEIKARQALFAFLPVYPELVALVGTKVPDYRGIFLRGQGSQTSTHYGTVVHSSAALGQLQGDAIREIWGSFPEMIAPGSSPMTHGALYYGSPWAYGTHIQQGTAGWMKRSADFLASRVIPVAQEIRPVNRAVCYLIRAR